MRAPDRFTTETFKRPASQIAAQLAQAPLKPGEAHRPSRYKSDKASPVHPKPAPKDHRAHSHPSTPAQDDALRRIINSV